MSSESKNHTEIRGQAIICFLIAALAFVPAIAGADTYIYGPTVIDSPGTYVLMSDVLNYNGTVYYNGTEYWEPCFKILASDVVLDGNGHTITGVVNSSRTDYYLSLGYVPDQNCIMVNPGLERVHVKNFRILGEFDVGIDYYPVVDGLIENNELSDNAYGIFTWNTNNVDIIGNTATGNRFEGIFCQGYFDGKIQGNTANNNDIGIYLLLCNQNTIDNNTANSNKIDGINDDGGSGNIFSRNTANLNAHHGINLTYCHDSTVRKNTADSNGNNGIFLWNTPPYAQWNGITVDDNHAWRNGWDGINLTNSSHNVVSSNSVEENNIAGISLNDFDLGEGDENLPWDTTENLVDSNEAHHNGMYGIISRGASKNTYRDNHVSYNPIGIDIGEVNLVSAFLLSDVNRLEGNVVHNNEIAGIYVHGHDYVRITSQNVLTGNKVAENDRMGIHLAYANAHTVKDNVIYGNGEVGMQVNASAYNNIFNNCFNNTYNVAFGDMIFQNTWNVLKQPGPNIVGGMYISGNYWAEPDGTGHSQVTGPNDDEFCNLSLYLASLNVDNFPLWNPLVASFTTNPSTPGGEVPFTVYFTDTSLGNPTCWFWDFGDGDTSTLQNPSHTYTSDGTYAVTFTASRCPVAECASTSLNTTVVHVGPQADFTATPLVGPAPLTVTFTDTSTVTGTTYHWDFGDSGTSAEQNPVHKYMNPGLYTVSLTVTGTFGSDTETKVNYIDVRTPLGPVADFTASPQSGTVPLAVNFIDMSSGDCTDWAWDFGDGLTSDERNPVHTYTVAGDYTVELTVTNTGGSASKTMVIHAMVPEPIADFIATPRSGYYPLEVSFIDRSYGTTPDTEYYWTFGDGGSSHERDPFHVYSSEGSYDVHLWVTNPNPANPAFAKSDDIPKNSYIVVSADPIPVASILPHDWWLLMGDMPFTIDFQGVSTYTPTTWLWTFGDGTSANQQDVSHTFTKPGVYDVTLRVFDEQGRGTQDTVVVVVRPVADFIADPDSGDAPLTVQFTDTSSGNPDEFYWNFYGGFWPESTEQDPEYTYQFWGTKYVSHWVRANGVWSTVIWKAIPVGDTPAINAFPTSGQVPLEVNFEGIAGGYPVDWLWEFGDGHYQHGQTASHTYENTGIYTVKLTAYYNIHDPVSTTVVIEVRPDADFIATPDTGHSPLTVQFTDTSLGTIADYYWQASDGWTSTAKNPSHAFIQSGYYYVFLTVETPEGLTDTTMQVVKVFPDADFTWYPSQGGEPLTVQFVDTSLGGGFKSVWDFGDGTTATFWDSPGRSAPVHVYEELGTYTVSLTRMGYDHLPDTETKVVNLLEQPPAAEFTGTPRTGSAPLVVDFTDLSSSVSPMTYYWEFGDGVTSTSKNPSHRYSTNGDYTVKLTVTNAGGSDSETKAAYIRVSDVLLPVADFTASPRDGIEDLTVQFRDTSINSPTSWSWNFGDGSTSNLQSPIHTYTTPGWYDVTLTVSNAQGQNSLTWNNCIYVRNIPPIALFNADPRTGDAPLTVQFTDESTGLGITSWQWNFGDGSTSTTQSPLYVYNTAGTYTVTLTVANDGGANTNVKTNYITVSPAPPANIIKLYPGWNFVSVPKRLASGHNTAFQVFGGVNLGGHAILLWDAQNGMWKQVMAGDTLQPLNGYWVYSVTRVDVPLTFDTVTPPAPYPKQLYAGWNAVGYAGTTSMSAHNFLTIMGGLDGNWGTLLGYHEGNNPDSPIIRDSNDGLPMYPTKGYWISMNNNDTLTVVV
ncbi:MAG: PKD domain-containing protein [Methanoregulaceae archaeon]